MSPLAFLLLTAITLSLLDFIIGVRAAGLEQLQFVLLFVITPRLRSSLARSALRTVIGPEAVIQNARASDSSSWRVRF